MGAALAYVPPNSDVQKHLFSLPWCLVAGGPVLGCKVWARAEEQLSSVTPRPLALPPLSGSLSAPLHSPLRTPGLPLSCPFCPHFTGSSCPPHMCWALGG